MIKCFRTNSIVILEGKRYKFTIYYTNFLYLLYTSLILEINIKIISKSMEKAGLNTFFLNTENSIKNENISCNSNLYALNIVDNILPPKNSNKSASINQMNECFKKLRIQSSLEYNEGKYEYLAGEIKNIIVTLHTVVIKPSSPNNLLYLGTPLFLIHRDFQNNKSEYILLGYIDDIFGSIGDPMYSVTIRCNVIDVLINAQVYYFSNNPNTLRMYIEHTIDKMSNEGKYKVKTTNLQYQ